MVRFTSGAAFWLLFGPFFVLSFSHHVRRQASEHMKTSRCLTESSRNENAGLTATFIQWLSEEKPALMNKAWLAQVARESEVQLHNGVLTKACRSAMRLRLWTPDPALPPLHFERMTAAVVTEWIMSQATKYGRKRRIALRYFFADFRASLPEGWTEPPDVSPSEAELAKSERKRRKVPKEENAPKEKKKARGLPSYFFGKTRAEEESPLASGQSIQWRLTESGRRECASLAGRFVQWLSANEPDLVNKEWAARVAREAGVRLEHGVLGSACWSVIVARLNAPTTALPPILFERVTAAVVARWLRSLGVDQTATHRRRRSVSHLFLAFNAPLPEGYGEQTKAAMMERPPAGARKRARKGKNGSVKEEEEAEEDEEEEDEEEEEADGSFDESCRGFVAMSARFIQWLSANEPEVVNGAWAAQMEGEAGTQTDGAAADEEAVQAMAERLMAPDAELPPLHFARVSGATVTRWLHSLDCSFVAKRMARAAVRQLFDDYEACLPDGWQGAKAALRGLYDEGQDEWHEMEKLERKKLRVEDEAEGAPGNWSRQEDVLLIDMLRQLWYD